VTTCTRSCLASALTLLVLTCSPRLDARELEARRLFTRANEALSAGRRHEALALFLRSLALTRRPSTILNIAQCYRLLDFPERALRYYRRYLGSHADSTARTPYKAEVRVHIGRLQVQRGLLVRAREHQRDGDHRSAVRWLELARQRTRWPGLELLLARSQEALRDEAGALAAARRALAGYERHLRRWREAGIERAPRHVQEGADAARQLVRRLERARQPRKPSTLPLRTEGSKGTRGWLVGAVVAGGLALAAEVLALVYYQRAEQLYTNDPTFETYRSVVLGLHVTAGVLALVSGTSIALHFTLARPEASGGGARGAVVTATVRF
jgi:tetratricopeptide (TPR) repeat protein